jgi:hypothetical protein
MFAAMADAIHSDGDSSRRESAPENELVAARIKKFHSGKWREFFNPGDPQVIEAVGALRC